MRKTVLASIRYCDFCRRNGYLVKAVYDAKTRYGPWAYMCDSHWKEHSYQELGAGLGQEIVYDYREDVRG